MSDFNLFRNEVLSLYQEKRKRNELHSKLSDPSPANLRDYSLVVLSHKLSEDDKKIMEEFYNDTKKYESLEKAISKGDITKLKSLQNFILVKTRNPDELLVKLLAVLLDYQPRPFVWGEWKPKEEREKEKSLDEGNALIDGDRQGEEALCIHGDSSHENMEVKEIEVEFDNGGGKKTDSVTIATMNPVTSNLGRLPSKKWLYLAAIASVVIMLFIGWRYVIPHQCMCWEGDRYVEIDCAAQTNLLGSKKVPLDHEKLSNFKKITRPDTLTLKHVNKVWYSKIDHDVEFFTSSGFHPEHTNRSLKAATERILTKYAGNSIPVESKDNEPQTK